MCIDSFVFTDDIEYSAIVGMSGPGKEGSLSEGEIRTHDISLEKCRRAPETMTYIACSMMRIKRKIRYRKILLHISAHRASNMLIKI
jgi:hypothetical protein